MNSVKKNFSYNIMYQILILILPLITAPYISRVIGAEGQGIFSYTYSIAQYFVLFAMLGLNNYGNRTIAKNKKDKEQLSKTFWAIYFMQIITSCIIIIFYIFYIIFFVKEYKIYATIQLLYVISAIFDINWFFFGMEKFKFTVIRNTFIKIASVLCIFAFVKNTQDLIIYTIIMTGSSLISQLLLWPIVKKYTNFIRPTWNDIKKHFKPNIILFIPVIAVSLYKIMDKVMLGSLTNVKEVGYYENAEKIINIPMAFLTALGTVMLPRITTLLANKEEEKINEYINKSMEFMMFLSIPLVFGLIAVGKSFAPLFFGQEFEKTGDIIEILSITIFFISWANVIRTQYLIPKEKDRTYIVSVFLGAIVNLIINFMLIPSYASIGAAIGTVIAEATVMIFQTVTVRKELEVNVYMKYMANFLLKGLFMFIIVKIIDHIVQDSMLVIVLQVLIGVFVYGILNYKYIYKYIISINIKSKEKEKIKE